MEPTLFKSLLRSNPANTFKIFQSLSRLAVPWPASFVINQHLFSRLPNTFIPLPGEVDILLVKGKNQTKVGNYKWKILPAHLHKATIKQNRKTKIGKSESPEKKQQPQWGLHLSSVQDLPSLSNTFNDKLPRPSGPHVVWLTWALMPGTGFYVLVPWSPISILSDSALSLHITMQNRSQTIYNILSPEILNLLH